MSDADDHTQAETTSAAAEADRPSPRSGCKKSPKPLSEPNVELLANVVDALGMDAVEELYRRTLDVEASGGMLTVRGNRRRTAGGVLFFLARKQMSETQQNRIFGEPTSHGATPKPDPPTLQQAYALLRATVKLSARQERS